jgi:hypothetical protein
MSTILNGGLTDISNRVMIDVWRSVENGSHSCLMRIYNRIASKVTFQFLSWVVLYDNQANSLTH